MEFIEFVEFIGLDGFVELKNGDVDRIKDYGIRREVLGS